MCYEPSSDTNADGDFVEEEYVCQSIVMTSPSTHEQGSDLCSFLCVLY